MLEIIKLIFGSNPSSMRLNEKGKNLVTKMYQTWLKLRHHPRYLFESTEKLIISPQLRTNFILILQQILVKIKNLSRNWLENVVFSLVFVDGKLVSQFHCKCSKSSLGKKSLLLIQLLIDTLSADCHLTKSDLPRSDLRMEPTEMVLFLDPITSSPMYQDQFPVPVVLRILPIKNSMSLVFISETYRQPVAIAISCLLQIFNNLLYRRNELRRIH